MVADPAPDMIGTCPMSDISHQIWDMKYRLQGGRTARPWTATWPTAGRAWRWRWPRPRRRSSASAAAQDFAARAGRSQIPARGPHPGRRGHRPQRHPLQLFCDGHHRGFDGRDLLAAARSGADPAAGRRHRLRLFHLAAQGRAGGRRGRGCLRSRLLHGCVGCDVPHHHERRLAARRHDGDLARAIIPTSRTSSTPSARPAGFPISTCRCW